MKYDFDKVINRAGTNSSKWDSETLKTMFGEPELMPFWVAYATIPNGGLSLMILLMCITYIAMQVSPTHICLAIVTEHYGTSFINLVKKTIPILISFVIISSLYSYMIYLLQI